MKAWILLMLALTLPMVAQAEEAKEAKEGEAPKVSYISLTPPFVGNYGLDGTAKLKVFKADIALRVTGTEAAAAVKANDALIRNQLVALFTQQTNEAMSTVEGKEKLRQEALKQTQQVMNDETGKPMVEDLLFNNLIIQ
ncbi:MULTISPECIES: flagellar basal body-associated FliL family protein [Pseudomonas]|uniref:flagellar basal body-associated FliL family protein n=1 Tax=Pseudomonas TaxID=286 RepID=UPI0008120C38|nr:MULTISPECIES: flagellar basal body-associated FliL family protein [Pseudomonas]MDO4234759.1 flagellar basal body-associated FliL family protein [Pseudomonas sp.]RZI20585.1 flagellar basal body-associated protein FliL [Pseudomonas orientalis]CRM35147.1 flagellar basal body-associated protein FliL-like protein [Pseudomonas sp. 28 E 9]CRM55569.1 flagellar basal body-associated protein FliL-like protein [Pseudomonas sp. 44 R 15]CRN02842.1 flagellar basal body-associated protein FliL-like protei